MNQSPGHLKSATIPVPVRKRSTAKKTSFHSPYLTTSESNPVEFVNEFWQHTTNVAELEDNFKHQALPLARIKKVMKSDFEVKMISSEVTILLEKACQIFIQELTSRAHFVSLAAKRRTITEADVSAAVSRFDMYDFLIDLIPREVHPTPLTNNGTEVYDEEEDEENEEGKDDEGTGKRKSKAKVTKKRKAVPRGTSAATIKRRQVKGESSKAEKTHETRAGGAREEV